MIHIAPFYARFGELTAKSLNRKEFLRAGKNSSHCKVTCGQSPVLLTKSQGFPTLATIRSLSLPLPLSMRSENRKQFCAEGDSYGRSWGRFGLHILTHR